MKPKKRIAYYITVYDYRGHVIHDQYIFPNKLHLIATFFKDNPEASRVEVTRDELSPDHWLFT